MNDLFQFGMAVLTILILSSTVLSPTGVKAGGKPLGFQFEQQETDPAKFIVLAQPLNRDYKLLILEQITDSKACWRESGSEPVTVDPLLVNFNFTGLCGRSIDSNGYSIRQAGQDLVLKYSLQIEQQGGDLVLLGKPLDGIANGPLLILGRSHGIAPGDFNKIFLGPGWRLTRRIYAGKPTGHIYLTSDFSSTGTATPTFPVRSTSLMSQ